MVLKVTTKTLLATGVLTAAALLAVSSPASAVPAPFTDPSISTTGDTPASGTNPAQVIATMTSNVAGVRVFSFQAAQWTFVNVIQNPGTCPSWFTVTSSPSAGTPTCQTGFNGSDAKLMLVRFPNDVASGTTVTMTIGANELNASASGQKFFFLGFDSGMSPLQQSEVNLPAPPTPAPAPPPAPAADPTLATTGSEATPWIVGAGALLTAGVAGLVATRRRRVSSATN